MHIKPKFRKNTAFLLIMLLLASFMILPGYSYGDKDTVYLVSIKTVNGKYLSLKESTDNIIYATRDKAGEAETFELVKETDSNGIAIKAKNGKYLRVKEDGIYADGNANDRETFQLIKVKNNKVAFETHDKKYISSENGGGKKVTADKDKIGPWERFELVEVKQTTSSWRELTKTPVDNSITLTAKPNKNSITFTWTKPENTRNILGYNLYRGTSSGKQSSIPITDFPIKGTTHTDYNIESDTTYYYVLRVVYEDDSLGSKSNEVTTKLGTTISLWATTLDNGVYLHWDKPSDTKNIIGYNVYRSTSSGNKSSSLITNSPIKDNYYTDYNINSGTTYYYVVKAVYEDKSLGLSSNEVNTRLNTLINLRARTDKDGIYLYWDKPTDSREVVGYYLYRTTTSGTKTSTPTTDFYIKDTYYLDKNVKDDTNYYYTLRPVYRDNSLGVTSNQVAIKSTLKTTTIVLKVGSKYMEVNGISKNIDPGNDTSVILKNGRTFLPIRAVIESMGGEVEWSESNKRVTIRLDDSVILLWIGDNTAKVNGVNKETDVAPYISNSGRTMLPLRFIVENLDCEVNWDGKTETVTITTTK
ncbi:MAG: stalk domain-containing protein [Tissierellaceae bacterium]|nr:stalk domain-containing protein [Tissierellaceae bacterium]